MRFNSADGCMLYYVGRFAATFLLMRRPILFCPRFNNHERCVNLVISGLNKIDYIVSLNFMEGSPLIFERQYGLNDERYLFRCFSFF